MQSKSKLSTIRYAMRSTILYVVSDTEHFLRHFWDSSELTFVPVSDAIFFDNPYFESIYLQHDIKLSRQQRVFITGNLR